MSAISLSSFASRAGGANYSQQAQRGGLQGQQVQRGGSQGQQAQQAQRGTTYGSSGSAVGSPRADSSAGAGAAFCPTCGGARSNASNANSYCPTCNQAGGRQSSVTGANPAYQAGQGGRTAAAACPSCAYQGR